MYPSPPDITSMGGIVDECLRGDSGVRTGDPITPGTATKNVTASRCPWNESWACAIEHQGILPVGQVADEPAGNITTFQVIFLIVIYYISTF